MHRLALTPLLILNLLACPVTCAGEVSGTGPSTQVDDNSAGCSGCCVTIARQAEFPDRDVPESGTPRPARDQGCNCPCLCRGAVLDQPSTKLQDVSCELNPVLCDADAVCSKAETVRFSRLGSGPDLGRNTASGRSLCVALRALLL